VGNRLTEKEILDAAAGFASISHLRPEARQALAIYVAGL
jgi:hypothetical protein